MRRRTAGAGLAALAGVAVLSAPRDAAASGYAAGYFGGEHGTVVTTNPTALYYNPAGIGFSQGTDIYIDGTLALRGQTWTHPSVASDQSDGPDPPAAAGANSGTAHLLNVFGGPALGATTKLGNLALGAGLFVPFGGQESWQQNSQFAGSPYPLAAAGVQRWHVIDAALTFIYGTLGAAYRFGPLSIGVTGNLVLGSVSFTQAKNADGTGLPDTQREGRADVDVSGVTGSFGLGVMLEAVPDRVWLAASYQSQPNMGPQTMNGKLTISQPYASPPTSLTQNIGLTQALPDILRAGARWRPRDDLELRLFGSYTRWSVNKTQCVAIQGNACAVYADGSDASPNATTISNFRRDWNDTFGIRGGASYWLQPEIELFAGTGYENAATPNSTLEPSTADADNVLLAGGARFLIAHWFYLAASYTQLFFFDRNNTGQSTLASAAVPTQQQDGGGSYTQWIGLFDLNVEKTF